jgi:hypothetical protein
LAEIAANLSQADFIKLLAEKKLSDKGGLLWWKDQHALLAALYMDHAKMRSGHQHLWVICHTADPGLMRGWSGWVTSLKQARTFTGPQKSVTALPADGEWVLVQTT